MKAHLVAITITSGLHMTWSAHASCPLTEIVASDSESYQQFGISVDLDSDIMVVGAPAASAPSGRVSNKSAGPPVPTAYVFRFNGSSWQEEEQIFPPISEECFFGLSVAVDAEVIAISSECGIWSLEPGAVYVYRWNGNAWAEEAVLTAVHQAQEQPIGPSLALSGNVLAVSTHDLNPNLTISGAVHVFRFSGGSWQPEARLFPSDGQPEDYFGSAVAAQGDLIVAASSTAPAGAIYFFRFDGANWVEEQKVTASEMGTPSFLNAQAMAVDGGLVVVGAPFEDGAAPSSGAAYVLRRLAGTWVAEQRILLSGNEEPNQFYASSVDVRGQRIAIAHNRIPAVDYFHYSGSEWVKRTTVEATPTGVPPAPDGNFFGNMMALDAQHLAFGWPHGDGVAPSSGVIYSVDVKECFSIPAISGSGIIVLAVGTMIVGAAVLRRPGVWTPRSR